MAWVKRTKKRDGSITYWVHDFRNGSVISIAECPTEKEATYQKERYEIHRDLAKDGYFDRYEKIADRLFGRKQ